MTNDDFQTLAGTYAAVWSRIADALIKEGRNAARFLTLATQAQDGGGA
ncbi:MAG: hypothetical protein HRU32_14495 [Rhodobacteraceae bacterium]|nr:hypothetical protein [Paracoccaceae bacterium]